MWWRIGLLSAYRLPCPLQLMLLLPKFLIRSPLAPFPLFFSKSHEVDPDSLCLLVFVDVSDGPFEERDPATSISSLPPACLWSLSLLLF